MVASDLMRRGYKIAFPYGEDWNYDLVLCRADETLERVQVKYCRSNGEVISVPARSVSLTAGKVKAYKYYTSETIDWLAVYEASTESCFYVPARELGSGMCELQLRLTPPKNNQRVGIRYARDYADI